MAINIDSSWSPYLQIEFEKPYIAKLKSFLEKEILKGKTIYPHPSLFFEAFKATRFENVRVVILGQDPYHGKNQAHGLSFSIPKTQKKIPPSLQNIFREAGIKNPPHGNLENWASQGVFLLNATLSVEDSLAGSHQKKGWELFTDSTIKIISDNKVGVIFLLWGNFAISKRILIDETKHTVLTAPHPSPLSAHRGFFGCGHFEKVNEILKQRKEDEINWNIS